MTEKLDEKSCIPCKGGVAALNVSDVQTLLAHVDQNWAVQNGNAALIRRLEFKGFAKAVYHANIAAWLGDDQGHHPDIRFGWGYCEVEFTTHEAGGLTENDFICAAKFDRMIAA